MLSFFSKRIHISAIIFSLIVSFLHVVGRAMYISCKIETVVSYYGSICSLFFTLVYSFVIAYILFLLAFYFFTEVSEKRSASKVLNYLRFHSRKSLLFFWLFIFICYIPVLLAYYPGVYSYDIQVETPMALGLWRMTSQNPPFHVFLWKFFLLLEHNTGILAVTSYAIFSMLFLSFSFAYAECFIIKVSNNIFIAIFSLLFFAINPLIAIMSIVPTKDVIFAGFFTLFTTELSYLILNQDFFYSNKKHSVLYLFFIFMCCMFRNNAFIPFLIAVPIIGIKFNKANRLLTFLSIAVVILYIVLFNIIFPLVGIPKWRSAELMSLPIYQVSNVVVNDYDSLTEDEISEIEEHTKILYMCLGYNPRIVDKMKVAMVLESQEDARHFLKIWYNLGQKHPLNYFNAFISQCLPYWYPFSDAVDYYSNRFYIETSLNIDEYYSFEPESKIPQLKKIYESIASNTEVLTERLPIANVFLSLSWPLLIMLFCSIVNRSCRNTNFNLVLLPSFLYWLTYFFGPVCNFRYIFPIIVLFPIFFATLNNKNSVPKGTESESVDIPEI